MGDHPASARALSQDHIRNGVQSDRRLSAIEDFKIFKIVGSGIIDPHFIEDYLGESQRAPGGEKGCSLEK